MNQRSQFILTTLLILSFISNARSQTVQKDPGDFEGAKILSVNKEYAFKNSPKGFGKKQEFPANKNRSRQIFKQERNTGWFLIPIPYDGILSFEISPHNPADDYDWMLFSYSRNFRQNLSRRLPLRTNNAKNDTKINGKTGLKDGSTNLYAVPGPGNSYSKLIKVKKNDTLILVIDNINQPTGGFDFTSRLAFDISLPARISGTVYNSRTKTKLPGRIICEDDSSGMVLSSGRADLAGNFSIDIPLNRAVNITADHPGFLFKTVDLVAKNKLNKQDFGLEPIEHGRVLILFNIHFRPDKDIVLPSAFPELQRLTDFMRANPDYDVKITGHTNNNPFADSRYLQRLSFNRAIAVKKYLMTAGVTEERMSCTGVGGKRPLIVTKDPEEAMKNLRVEVELMKRQ